MLYPNPMQTHEVAMTAGRTMPQSEAQRLAQLSRERTAPEVLTRTAPLAVSLKARVASIADTLRIEEGLRHAAHYASFILS